MKAKRSLIGCTNVHGDINCYILYFFNKTIRDFETSFEIVEVITLNDEK
jgi:hypothetical protein